MISSALRQRAWKISRDAEGFFLYSAPFHTEIRFHVGCSRQLHPQWLWVCNRFHRFQSQLIWSPNEFHWATKPITTEFFCSDGHRCPYLEAALMRFPTHSIQFLTSIKVTLFVKHNIDMSSPITDYQSILSTVSRIHRDSWCASYFKPRWTGTTEWNPLKAFLHSTILRLSYYSNQHTRRTR